VETLGEIDHEAREEAATLGIEKFEVTAGLMTRRHLLQHWPIL